MNMSEFLSPDRVVLDVRVRDKAQLLTEIAKQFGRSVPGLSADTVERVLAAREQLGSTGLGSGFALPHARVEGLKDYAGLFLRLSKAIDYDAIDGKPVGLVFVLLIPFDSPVPHVQALAAISRKFRDVALVEGLRAAKSSADAYGLLTRPA